MIKTAKNPRSLSPLKLMKEIQAQAEIQIAILTERINQLTRIWLAAKHDFNTQRGLLMLVGQRRRLLNYLSKEDVDRYHQVHQQARSTQVK